jgi:hypothetical protein
MARQSPMRRRHSPRLPLRLRTSPAGRRSIAVRMRSRSSRGSLRRVFAAAGATTASHEGSSGVRFRPRAQLGHVDRLAPPVRRPAILRCLSVLPGVELVVKRRRLERRDHRVLRAYQQDASRVHALLWKLVHKTMQLGSRHDLNVASRPEPRMEQFRDASGCYEAKSRFLTRSRRRTLPPAVRDETSQLTPPAAEPRAASSPRRPRHPRRKHPAQRLGRRPIQRGTHRPRQSQPPHPAPPARAPRAG